MPVQQLVGYIKERNIKLNLGAKTPVACQAFTPTMIVKGVDICTLIRNGDA